MDAKKVVKKAVNVALQPAEIVLGAVNKADRVIHKVTDEPMTAKIRPVPQDYRPVQRKGTQSGHAVTDNSNHTKPLTPAEKQAQAKRPAVGNDADAKKKYGSKSWNNGYTN